MQPFGGAVVHRLDPSPEHLARLGGFFRNGDFTQEIVQAIASGDVAVLVTIERQSVEVGGLPRQEWPLRVTLVFRREDGEWRLAHRHADPLVRGISLDQAAALARGEDAPEHDARAEDERAGGERGGGARGGGTRVSVSRHPLGEPGGG
ncbi:MAG: hypothetical protein BGO51_09510 [Rhodospirillales bacterium 69-11]|nr:nuclear transport factor 2 family protein [Rhodospirillales bacterium]MBN8926102.1 nuclear transport factor 2 family protein [Rhodospirillales bacterium]OJW26119.1 MAG: hypothetical protein BGO51_09510 [Rhodospirillales bacterium 69-11]